MENLLSKTCSIIILTIVIFQVQGRRTISEESMISCRQELLHILTFGNALFVVVDFAMLTMIEPGRNRETNIKLY